MRPATLDELLESTRKLAGLSVPAQAKTAAEVHVNETPEGASLRKLAREMRQADLHEVKLSGIKMVLDGERPSLPAMLFESKTAGDLDVAIQPGATESESLRKLASALRDTAAQLKEAALVDGLNTVRGFGAVNTLGRYLR